MTDSKTKRGFAAMSPERLLEVTRKGGSKGAKDGAIKGFAAFDKKKHKEASRRGGRRSRSQTAL